MAGDLKTQIAVGVDGTGVTAGVDGIKKSLDTLGQKAVQVGKQASDGIDSIGTGAAPTAAKVDAATKNMIGSIQRQIAVMEAGSKSGADYYRVLAGQRGIDTGALKPYLDQLDAITAKQKAAQTALQGAAPALDRVGVSAAQTAAALRGVPAQFTDIITSIQGGQNPLTVFLQQGGQLKDMFGGAGAAARALGGYVASLVNPFTLAAAALGVIALAAYQSGQEMTGYSKALILTGGASGKTAGDLQVLARQIAATSGTQSEAAAALVAAVSSGKVAASALESVGAASVSMSRTLGISIDDAVAQFTKLSDEPAKASAKLNEQYHYLNASTYERIRALEEEGQKEAAVALAQKAYADASVARMRQVQEQAGILSRSLSGLKDVAAGMWQTISGAIGSIGAQQTSAQQVIEAQRKVDYLQKNGSTPQAMAAARGELESANETDRLAKRAALTQAERQRGEEEKIAAIQRLADQKKATRSRADQRKEEIEQLDRDAKAVGLSKDEYDKRAAAINEKYKDPKGAKGAKPKAFQDDAATKYLQDLREQEAALVAQITLGEKLNGVAKKQAEFEQLIADIKGKSQLTAAQKSMLAREDELRAALKSAVLTERIAEIEKSAAEAAVKAAAKRIEAEKNTARAVTGNTVRIADSLDRQREQYDDRLGVVGLGSQAAEELKSRQQVEREYARMQSQLTRQAAENATLEGEAYKQGTRDIAAAREQALGINDAYYTRLREMQGDSSLGAAQALANYRDESANVYKQVEQLTGNAFKGMEDALVTFATTGKLNFKSLADSIVSDLIRMQARAAITSAIGGSNGWLSSLLGGGSSTIAGASLSNSFIKGVGMSASGIVPMAKGGVFDSPSLSAFSGGVYDRPQMFAFAKGAGVFGEAGPEAIMPLRRGRDGKLGVAASAGGSPGQGMMFAPVTNIQIDARTDQGAVYEIANRAVADAQESYTEELRRMKVLPQ